MRKLLLAITILWLPSVLSSQVLNDEYGRRPDVAVRNMEFCYGHIESLANG